LGSHGPAMVRWEPSKNPVSPYLQTGVVVSLTQSATGLAFATFSDSPEVKRRIEEELSLRRAASNADTGDFERRVAEARQHGLARAIGKAPSQRHQVTVNAFSAPVFDAQGRMVMALSTTCQADRLRSDWYGEVPCALLGAARRLSARMGHTTSPAVAAQAIKTE
jgi:DNA-binding IclR family transcriptional regulator